MTMMTPLGQGGRMYPSRRRWPKVLFVGIVLVAVLAGLAYGVWRWLDGRDAPAEQPAARPSPSCSTPEVKAPKVIPPPRQVSVDVLNGTDESGLAIATADTMSTRGFDVQDIGNAPQVVKSGAAVVRYDQRSFGGAIRVAAYVEGAALKRAQGESARGIALWICPDFEGVRPAGEANVDEVELPSSAPVCK